jgi:beta-N-acetylhexosaminidase
MSPAVVRGLLRERLGFDGAIMTDCLEMRAISATVGVAPGAVLALQAGADLVLISHTFERQREAIEVTRTALANGQLGRESIRLALARVARLKARLTWGASTTMTADEAAAHAQVRDRAYARSTTLAANSWQLVPLHLAPEQRLLVIAQHSSAVSQAVDVYYHHAGVVAAIRQRHRNVIACELPVGAADAARRDAVRAAAAADVILAIMVNARFDPAQTALMQEVLATGHPVIGIAAGEPYDLARLPTLAAGIATYEYSPPALEAAVRVIFGETEARGTMP